MTSSVIEISREAVEHNQRFVRDLLAPGVHLSVVVKGNAYGHGVDEFVPLAMDAGADHFSVFSDDEARAVKDVIGDRAELMIMGNISPENLPWIIAEGIQFYVFDIDRLRWAIRTAQELGRPARIHLEVETGMNRTGLVEDQLPGFVEMIRESRDHVVLEGICTHYAGAESITNHVRARQQLRRFRAIRRNLQAEGIEFALQHTACSASAVRYPDTQMDMVRSGILNFGFWPSRELLIHYLQNNGTHVNPLRRVISWKSYLMSVKEVAQGEYVGYGTSFLSYEERRIGVVPLGYAHGYSRALSNNGILLVRGRRVPIIGMINMNALTVDLSTVEEAETGDEVVVIGASGEVEASVASFGERSNLVNYEILSRLPSHIPRRVVD